MTTEEYLERRKSKDWNFNAVVPLDSFANVQKIHPLKQMPVKKIVEAARDDNAIKSIIVFGSGARYDCTPFSDLDLCLDWNDDCYDSDGVLKPFTRNMYKAITAITQGNVDIINYQELDNTIVKDSVLERGVVVYEHNV